MPTTSIDQILQIAVPKRAAADSSKAEPPEGARFQDHLQRASTSDESTTESQGIKTDNEEGDVAVGTGEDQDGSLEQNKIESPVVEGEESNAQLVDGEESILDADDILISSAAILAVESDNIEEVPVEAEVNPATVVQVLTTEEISGESVEAASLVVESPEETAGETLDYETTNYEVVDSEVVDNDTQTTVPATEIDQGGIVYVANQTDQNATSNSTTDMINTDSDHQDTQSLQLSSDGGSSEQGSTGQPDQSPVEQATSGQTAQLNEVEQNQPPSESKSTDQNKGQSDTQPLAQHASLDQEIATVSTEVESAPAPAAVIDTNTNSEPVLSADRSTNTPSTQQSAATVESANETEATPTIDRARFVQRVSGAFRAAKDQDGIIQLKLSPPELGTLRIEITVKQGVLTAQLETETAAARNVLLDSLPALRERLAEQEIRIEKFDVNVREEGQQQENPGAEDRRSNNTQAENRTGRSTGVNEEQEATLQTSNTIRQQTDLTGGLDVMI